MNYIKSTLIILLNSISILSFTQEKNASESIDKISYYEKRAKEDAKFEQEFSAETKKEERQFWKEQKQYEKELKRRDREAYEAYMQGKRDAYAEHYHYCRTHSCYHSDYYYHHARFYYHGYDYYYYRHPSRRTRISTSVRVTTPRIRLGF